MACARTASFKKQTKLKKLWKNTELNASLISRMVLEESLGWKAKLCEKMAQTETEMTISLKMAAVQEGTHYVPEASTSWSQQV